MNPTKITITAAVVALTAGCSATVRHDAATAARPTVPLAVTDSTTTSTTLPTPTIRVTPTTTSTTLAPAAATSRAADRTAPAPTAATTAMAPCPQNLPSELASTGRARQLITVVAAGWGTTTATVQLWQQSATGCWESAGGPWNGFIGQNGFSDHHIEGDSTTPTGYYGVGPEMYGNQPNPGAREPYHQLVCGDWWDEDSTSPGYNTFQHVPCGQRPPFGGGSEALWKETAPYPSFAVIDYNTGPIVKGAGSGIFFHADTGTPTVGCVSIPLPDLDMTLRWIDPSQAPAFVMGPANEIGRF